MAAFQVSFPDQLDELLKVLRERCGSSGLPLRGALGLQRQVAVEGSETRFWVDNWQDTRIIVHTVVLGDHGREGCYRQYITCAIVDQVGDEEIGRFLEHEGVVDWSLATVFVAARRSLKGVWQALAEKHGGTSTTTSDCYLYALGEEPSPDLDCDTPPTLPAGYTLGPIGLQHACFINSNWKFGSGNRTLEMIKRTLAIGGTFGAFHSSDLNADKQDLVSWGMIRPYGGIGMLQTIDDHRRRGLGRVVVVQLVKWLRERNCVPYCYIEDDNQASVALFEKLGFRKDADYQAMWGSLLAKWMEV